VVISTTPSAIVGGIDRPRPRRGWQGKRQFPAGHCDRYYSWRSASMGLSAAARRAGKIAEHDADQRRDAKADQVDFGHEHEIDLHSTARGRARELRPTNRSARRASTKHRLDQELRQHLVRHRADREGGCRSRGGALCHRDEHDVHDPDPADDQADRRDRGDDAGQQAVSCVSVAAICAASKMLNRRPCRPLDVAAFAQEIPRSTPARSSCIAGSDRPAAA